MKTRSDDTRLELESLSTAVANLPSEMPFAVPDGYFDRLPDQVLSLVQYGGIQEELEDLSPLLAGLRDINPLSVPEGYFSGIRPDMVIREPKEENNDAREAGQAIVRKMPARTLVIRLAVAASVFGLIALAAWLMTNRPDTASFPETVQVAGQGSAGMRNDSLAVSDEALVGFLLAEDLLPEAELLPEEDLQEAGELAILDLNESHIQDLLKDLSDDVLETYVTENPVGEAATGMN